MIVREVGALLLVWWVDLSFNNIPHSFDSISEVGSNKGRDVFQVDAMEAAVG